MLKTYFPTFFLAFEAFIDTTRCDLTGLTVVALPFCARLRVRFQPNNLCDERRCLLCA